MPERHPPLIGLTPPEGSFARRSEGRWVPRSAAQVLADIGGAAAADWTAERLAALSKILVAVGTASAVNLQNSDVNGYAVLSGRGFSFMTANCYHDGTNWQRYNTAQTASVWYLGVDGVLRRYIAASGANPISSWSTSDVISTLQITKLVNLLRADMDVKATYIGNVPAGTTQTVAHGWGDRPTIIGGWHDNGVGTGLYYYPLGIGSPVASTGINITYCDATNVKVQAGASASGYCYVTGVFPRTQQ